MVRRAVFLLLLVGVFAAPALADLGAQQKEVEAIRNASFRSAVTHRTISRDELRTHLQRQIETELPIPVADYMGALRALRLIGGESDPTARLLDLYQQQVVAFYDPKADIYYSIAGAEAADPVQVLQQQGVVLHELMHALQDQAFDAGKKIEALRSDWDAQMAYHAVLEGEATLVMLAAMFRSMGADLDAVLTDEALQTFFAAAEQMTATSVPTGTPEYFVSSLTFPYLEGLKFVVRAYRQGGWEAIDRIHANPPRSTSELFHPERYGKVRRPADLVPLKAATIGTTLGEFHWRFLFGEKAASGWAGDRVDLVKDAKGEWTVLADTRWIDAANAREFAEAAKGRFPDASVSQQGSTVRLAWGADRSRITLFIPPARK
jgi:hypothetical protein